MADAMPQRLPGKPAVDPNMPFMPQLQPGMANGQLHSAPNPLQQQKSALEEQIRSVEATGGDASGMRSQLASMYDQLNPNWRAQTPPKLPININSIPTRGDAFKNPDGSLNLDAIQPVPGAKFNTATTLTSALDKMFKGTEQDSLDDLAYKIEGRSKARSDIAPLLNSPDEAMSTVLSVINQFGGKQLPSQTLSPEETSYIEQSFEVGPGRKFATIDDIPDQYINFAIGYGLVGLASGGGLQGFTGALGAGLANAQQGFDQQFANDQAQFEARRAMNAALAKRQGAINDANFQQEGYYAKDMRDLVEKVTSSTMNLDRQTKVAVMSSIMPMIQNGDSDRWNAYVETMGPTLQQLGITLPKVLPKSSNEVKTDATVASMGIKDARLQQVMSFAADLHPLERDKLMTQISILDGNDKVTTERLELLKKQVAGYDKKQAAELMLMGVRAESLKKQADAAVARANNVVKGVGSGGSDPDLARLKMIATLDSRVVGQLSKDKTTTLKQISALEKQIEEWGFMLKSSTFKDANSQKTINDKVKDASGKLANLKTRSFDIDQSIQRLITAQESAATFLRSKQ